MKTSFANTEGEVFVYESARKKEHLIQKIKPGDIILEKGVIPSMGHLILSKCRVSDVRWGLATSVAKVDGDHWNLLCTIGDCIDWCQGYAQSPVYWRLGGFKSRLELNKHFSQPTPLP